MAQDRESLIRLRSADICGGDQTVLYGVDMDIFPGGLVYIVGKVGSGKTSLVRTLIGETAPLSGSCQVCGFRIERLRQRDIPKLRRKLGVIFQDFKLLTDRNVHDNLEFVLKATGWKDRKAIEERIDEVLNATSMQTKSHKMPYQLSGGEQQRIAIARAILNHPEVLLADEPTGNLDRDSAEETMSLLNSLRNEDGTAVIIVTHDKDIFESYRGRVFNCADEKCREILPDEAIELDIRI